MSQENPVQDISLIAGEDLSGDATSTTSKRYRALRKGANAREILQATTPATDFVMGILKNLPEQGEFATVSRVGTSKVRAGAAFAYGDLLKIDANGKFIKGEGGGDVNWAQALEAATADGEVIEAALFTSPRVT